MTETTAQPTELNDDCLINITLTNPQWNTITDWFSRFPFDEAKTILEGLNGQIEQFLKVEENKDKQFTASLSISTFNKVIFALSLAPYYIVAETVQQIFSQGQSEIQRLRDEANTLEKSEDQTTEVPLKTAKKKTTTRKKKASTTEA